MTGWMDLGLVLLLLTGFLSLGTSRIDSCIRTVAAQGVIAGLLALAARGEPSWRAGALAAGTVALKGAVFPWLLRRAMREARVHREVEPFVGYAASILAGILGLVAAVWLGARLPVPPSASPLVVPVALFLTFTGLFSIVSRRKAISQVIGYLVLENGIFVFGVALAIQEPLLVELGVLLDVFVAVFLMGITIAHINREFDHIDADRLDELKDWTP